MKVKGFKEEKEGVHASEIPKTQDGICFVPIPRPFIRYKYAKFISNKRRWSISGANESTVI